VVGLSVGVRLRNSKVGRFGGRQAGFTLTEIMIAMAIFLLLVIGIIESNLFGVRMLQATEPKLDADGQTSLLLERMTEDIKSAMIARVGTGDDTSFAAIALGSLQQGNALQLNFTNDTNSFVRYYRDSGNSQLMRLTNGAAAVRVASAVANAGVFTAEDFQEQPLTNDASQVVIRVTLQYSALGRAQVPLGPDRYFKAYQVVHRVASRSR
jgi:prepilin-type N-terminal cleavage/methylation domain-containing protein